MVDSNMSDSDGHTTASSSSLAFDDQDINSDLPDSKWQLQALESKYRNLIKLIVTGKSKISTVKSSSEIPSTSEARCTLDDGEQFNLEDCSSNPSSLVPKRKVVTSLSDDELKIKLLDKLCRVQVKLNDLIEREAFSLDDSQSANASNGNHTGNQNHSIASCNGHKLALPSNDYQLDPFNFLTSIYNTIQYNTTNNSPSTNGPSTMCDYCGKRINRFGYSTLSSITSAVMRPLASSLNSFGSAFLNDLLTCEYCLYQIHEHCFELASGAALSISDHNASGVQKDVSKNNKKGLKRHQQNSLTRIRPCPKILLDQYDLPNNQFISADQVIDSQNRLAKIIDPDDYPIGKIFDTSGLSEMNNLTLERSGHSENSFLTDTVRRDTAELSASPSINYPITKRTGSISNLSVKSLNPHQDLSNTLQPIGQYTGELLIMKICPEVGLHSQDFACADCDVHIDNLSSRLCHYDGKYYCFRCHTGDELVPIPARIIRNWDFTPKPVCRTSWHKICFIRSKPVLFNLFEMNSMLYGFIDKLVEIKQLRESLKSMLNYLKFCKQPQKPKLSSVPNHFLNDDLINYYSLNDLLNIQQVYESLCSLKSTLEQHIVKVCESCRGKGFFCELCKNEGDVLFPFSQNALSCNKCSAVHHKNCYNRKKKNCPKCIRLKKKEEQLEILSSTNAMTTT